MVKEFKAGKMNCGGKCLKILLFVINIFYFLSGLLIAGFAGFSAYDENSKIQRLFEKNQFPILYEGLYILLAVGIILIILSLLGIWGSLAENTCLLLVYLLALLLVFVLQIAGVAVCFVEFKAIESKAIEELGQPQSANHTSALYQGIKIFEEHFACCGYIGHEDYGENLPPPACYSSGFIEDNKVNNNQTDQPTSVTVSSSRSTNLYLNKNLFQKGCLEVAVPYVYASGGIAIAILFLELLTLIFTCYFMSAIRDQYEPVK